MAEAMKTIDEILKAMPSVKTRPLTAEDCKDLGDCEMRSFNYVWSDTPNTRKTVTRIIVKAKRDRFPVMVGSEKEQPKHENNRAA